MTCALAAEDAAFLLDAQPRAPALGRAIGAASAALVSWVRHTTRTTGAGTVRDAKPVTSGAAGPDGLEPNAADPGDAPPRPTFPPGTLLQNTYRISELLAVGGMGEVYVATHERLPGRFAVKVLSRTLAHDQDAYVRFCREAAVMSVLRHPNIVHVFDFNLTPDGRPYLVMELLEGRDLGQHMRVGHPMPVRQVTRIVRQIASALAAAHARGIVHRDLKPENVVLVPVEGQADFVKVLDFGISKARWSNRLTGDATVMGTPEFMAPEQAQGHREQIDARTDQFALAAMTYALLTGREPFTGDCSVTVLYQVVHEDPPPIADFVSWPTAEIEAVLRKGMAKRRTERYPTVLDFARAFEGAVASIVTGIVGDAATASVLRDSTELPPGVCALATVRSTQPPAEPDAELPALRRESITELRPKRRVSPIVMAVAASLVVLVAAALGVRWRWGGPANASVEEGATVAHEEQPRPTGLRAAMTWAEAQLGAPPPIIEPAAAVQMPSPSRPAPLPSSP